MAKICIPMKAFKVLEYLIDAHAGGEEWSQFVDIRTDMKIHPTYPLGVLVERGLIETKNEADPSVSKRNRRLYRIHPDGIDISNIEVRNSYSVENRAKAKAKAKLKACPYNGRRYEDEDREILRREVYDTGSFTVPSKGYNQTLGGCSGDMI